MDMSTRYRYYGSSRSESIPCVSIIAFIAFFNRHFVERAMLSNRNRLQILILFAAWKENQTLLRLVTLVVKVGASGSFFILQFNDTGGDSEDTLSMRLWLKDEA